MATNEQIEHYLMELDFPYEEKGEGTWVVNDHLDRIDNIVICHTPPVLFFRVKVMDLPQNVSVAFLKHLLRLNAELLHGRYALEDDSVIIMEALESEHLDRNEFLATFDALTLAITSHYEQLKAYL